MRLWPFRRRKQFVTQAAAAEAITNITGAPVGDGTRSSVTMAPLLWLGRQVSTIPIVLQDAAGAVVDNPVVTGLLTQRLLFSAAIDHALSGNVYLERILGGDGAPVALTYLAPSWVQPRPARMTDEVLLYRVSRPGRVTRDLHPDDMVHIRQGYDPQNPLLGLSPLAALMADLQVDVEATAALRSVLGNGAMIGTIVSPRPTPDGGFQFDQGAANAVRKSIDDGYRSANRGKTFATAMPVDITHTEADMEKLAMKAVRTLTESRVSAVLGIPPGVTSMQAGLDQTKVGATLAALIGIAWTNAVLPTIDAILEAMNREVVEELAPGRRLGYTLPPGHVSDTGAAMLAQRARELYAGGVATRNEAREMVGLPAVEGEDTFQSAAAGAPAPDQGAPEDDNEEQDDGDEAEA